MEASNTKIIQGTFNALEPATLQVLRKVARRRTYDQQTVLCKQGDIEDTFYIIVDGCIATTQELEDGSKRVICTLGANDYFGEMGLIDETPRIGAGGHRSAFVHPKVFGGVLVELVEEDGDHGARGEVPPAF